MIAPTLIIGLGGTGAKIVNLVSNLVCEEQRSRISFAVFDTDINELRKIHENNPLIYTIQTSTKLSVGEYLNIDRHARDNWFPVNPILNSKTLTEGAGQVRAISRLAFDTALRAGNLEPLHKAVESLYRLEEDHSDQALRVVIASSLAGGTGSGLILPVALYLKNYLSTRFQQSANIMRGFFIMPEVFYEVIRGQTERNNLKCNAYATLRELDAFLMKGDGTLPGKFDKTVRMEFPRVGSEKFEEYNVRPYDFCFLYDAQNTEGRKLNDFSQYLEHAAECIYSQSIGPMNKRSNSSEDNTIRELCAERGRNRYAGAGCSRLVYPFDDVQEYVALKWTQECVSSSWLCFDDVYRNMLAENTKMRSQGYNAPDTNRSDSYINAVEQLNAQKNPFAMSIVRQCTVFEDAASQEGTPAWDIYLGALQEFVMLNATTGQKDLDNQRQDACSKREAIQGDSEVWGALVDAYNSMNKYRCLVERRCEDTARTTAYAIFKQKSDSATKDKLKHQLETYLRDQKGNFIHPNAVRYFLYKTAAKLDELKMLIDSQISDEKEYFKAFVENFDDPNTDEKETSVNQLTDRKMSVADRMKNFVGKLTDDQETLKLAWQKYIDTVDAYRNDGILSAVIREGIEYVQNLSKAFERFYDSLDTNLSMQKSRINEIAKKYQSVPGKTTRYVCASSDCLDKFVEKIPYMGTVIAIDGDLSDEIYSRVRKYSMDDELQSNAGYFNEIVEKGIVGYFRKSLMMTYGPVIDMDIIDALYQEGSLKGIKDNDKLTQYVHDTIDNTRKLALPFIERPMGEQREPIAACTYNPFIDPKDDSAKSDLIAKDLKNFGAEPDDDISKREIMFFQSIYGLRANRLSKLCPAVPGVRPEGEYFKAYYEVVNRIMPKTDETPVVTPHIDRNWHVISNMPDLDDKNQKRLETRIYRAFTLGLIYGLIDSSYNSRGKNIYKIHIPGCKSEDFVVSNGTPCDQFYEILDALTLNPVVVDSILNEVERIQRKEFVAKTTFESSRFKKLFDALKLKQFNLAWVTLPDFSCLLKFSTPQDSFRNEQGTELLNVMLDVFCEYVHKIVQPSEADTRYGEFVVEQYRLFNAQNIKLYLNSDDEDYFDWVNYLDELYDVMLTKLRAMELDEFVDMLEDIKNPDRLKMRQLEVSDKPSMANRLLSRSPFTASDVMSKVEEMKADSLLKVGDDPDSF